MKIMLYDHRRRIGQGFDQDLGKIEKCRLSATGILRISKTEPLYSLNIHFTKAELEMLRLRLNELYEKRTRGKGSVVLVQAQEILEKKKGGN